MAIVNRPVVSSDEILELVSVSPSQVIFRSAALVRVA
jgi:hypothetical protein